MVKKICFPPNPFRKEGQNYLESFVGCFLFSILLSFQFHSSVNFSGQYPNGDKMSFRGKKQNLVPLLSPKSDLRSPSFCRHGLRYPGAIICQIVCLSIRSHPAPTKDSN